VHEITGGWIVSVEEIMKKIVIYYSFEGNTKLMAECIATAANAELMQVKPKKEIKSSGFKKYLRGGEAAMMEEKPKLLPLDRNPEDYDLIFIGTPVWAWSCAPPMNSFLLSYPIADKMIALFCCHGGNKGNIFEKMREILVGNHFIGEIDFRNPLKHDLESEIVRAGDWAAMIVLSAGDRIATFT
jgi:flavodoxin